MNLNNLFTYQAISNEKVSAINDYLKQKNSLLNLLNIVFKW